MILLLPEEGFAQLTGTIGLGGQATNNVQNLDTTAPDNMLLPAFELNYGWQLSGASKITFAGGYAPNAYTKNKPLSYNLTTLGATGTFYLSNLDAIAAESKEGSERSGSSRDSRFESLPHPSIGSLLSGFETGPIAIRPSDDYVSHPDFAGHPTTEASPQDVDDSLVEIAVGALYTLSGQLDSTEISAKGLSKSRIQEFEDLRDSISDVLSTAADLLDSTGYSQSAAEIIIPELKHVRTPLGSLLSQVSSAPADASLLDAALRALKAAKPESDFLATVATPAPSSTQPITSPIVGTSPNVGSRTQEPGVQHPAIKIEKHTTVEAFAPIVTLVQSGTELRDFGSSEVSVQEDLDDSGATTMATVLTIPVSWSSHMATNFSVADSNLFGGSFAGSPNDYRSLAFGAAVEGYLNTSSSLRGSYDFTKSTYPFDSVYSNTEHRFGLMPRLALGKATVLFGDAAMGFRAYLNPLQVTATVFHKSKDTLITKAAASQFTQYSYGIGLSQFVTTRWAIGGLVAVNHNPNLRAYVTTAQTQTAGIKGRTVRAAVQIADDEYTYNLSRYTVFSNARVLWDVDFGTDLSYEQRAYGSSVGPKGNPLPGGQGRTETGWFFNATISKLFPFEHRAFGAFNSFAIEGRLEVASVNASQSLYTYQATTVSMTATLGF